MINFIENYKTKMLLRRFEETKVLVDKLTKNWKERDNLEWQLYEKWQNHDCKDGCDICGQIKELELYPRFLKVASWERELILSTRC